MFIKYIEMYLENISYLVKYIYLLENLFWS